MKLTPSIYKTIASLTLVCVLFSYPFQSAEAFLDQIASLFGGGEATERTQMLNNAELATQTIQSTATAVATTDLFTKENLLDGIAWSVAKQTVSTMMQSMIDWVNSGFQGSPAFVTDIDQLLIDAADQAAGEYIESLGGVGEFLCSPFSLDVQVALSLSFAASRDGVTEASCTLTDIEDNLENFLQGSMTSWDQWLQVTTNPQNTPYGAYLTAEEEMNIAIRNAQGQSITLASWGDGFLSKKICEAVEGTYVDSSSGTNISTTSPVYDPSGGVGTAGANCIISTPGQVISQQLNQQLGLGSDALIEADEINELISALLNQVTLQAVQGINGLLGLSGSTGYTDTNYQGSTGLTYTEAMVIEQAGLNFELYRAELNNALALEREFLALIDTTASATAAKIDSEEAFILSEENEDNPNQGDISDSEEYIKILEQQERELARYRATTTQNIAILASSSRAYDQADNNEEEQAAILDYVELRASGQLITQAEMDSLRARWNKNLEF